jgi:nicotinate-nucleotide pyrophosphorylase (carboxylating)
VNLDPGLVRRLAEAALIEDRAWHDITTDALVPDDQQGHAVIVSKAPGVLAGLPVAQAVFAAADGTLGWQPLRHDGEHIEKGDVLAKLGGSLASILRGERCALNFLGHLSGIATATAVIVHELLGTTCHVRDTRKTTPGLRHLEKYAVHAAGGHNHRMDLADGILIKDNHIAALRARGYDIPEAIALARKAYPAAKIEVEVTSVPEARKAIAAGAQEILLDNMSLAEMSEVVAMVAGNPHRPALEASGNITLANARSVAETGVDFISMGALTHSVKTLDISLDVEPV